MVKTSEDIGESNVRPQELGIDFFRGRILESSVIAKQPGKNNYNENHVVFERLLIQKIVQKKNTLEQFYSGHLENRCILMISCPPKLQQKFTVASQI